MATQVGGSVTARQAQSPERLVLRHGSSVPTNREPLATLGRTKELIVVAERTRAVPHASKHGRIGSGPGARGRGHPAGVRTPTARSPRPIGCRRLPLGVGFHRSSRIGSSTEDRTHGCR